MVVTVLVVVLWYSLLVRRPLCLLPLGWRKKTVSLTLDHSDEEEEEERLVHTKGVRFGHHFDDNKKRTTT